MILRLVQEILLALSRVAIGARSVRVQASFLQLELIIIMIIGLERILVLGQVQMVHERILLFHAHLLIVATNIGAYVVGGYRGTARTCNVGLRQRVLLLHRCRRSRLWEMV